MIELIILKETTSEEYFKMTYTLLPEKRTIKQQKIWEKFNEYYEDWTSLSEETQMDIVNTYIKMKDKNMHYAYNINT